MAKGVEEVSKGFLSLLFWLVMVGQFVIGFVFQNLFGQVMFTLLSIFTMLYVIAFILVEKK